MTPHPRHPLPFPLGRPLLAACTLALGLLLGGCGGSGSSSGLATCTAPDTHCAPKP